MVAPPAFADSPHVQMADVVVHLGARHVLGALRPCSAANGRHRINDRSARGGRPSHEWRGGSSGSIPYIESRGKTKLPGIMKYEAAKVPCRLSGLCVLCIRPRASILRWCCRWHWSGCCLIVSFLLPDPISPPGASFLRNTNRDFQLGTIPGTQGTYNEPQHVSLRFSNAHTTTWNTAPVRLPRLPTMASTAKQQRDTAA